MAADHRTQRLKEMSIYDADGTLKSSPVKKLGAVLPVDPDSESLKGSAVDRVEKASAFDRSGVIR